MESLEERAVLNADFGVVTGIVSTDTNGNGVFDPGEALVGASIELFEDLNGDGLLDDDDLLIQTTATDANGDYEFGGLPTSSYLVVQPNPSIGLPPIFVSVPLSISGDGIVNRQIDSFDTDSGPVTDDLPAGTPVTDVFTAAEALGGQRDLTASIDSGIMGDTVAVRTAGGQLLVNPDVSAVGKYTVTWDGVDTASDDLSFSLGGIDLTDNNAGAGIRIGGVMVDQPNAILRLRVYTDADNFSQVAITSIDALVASDFAIPFVDDGDGFNFVAAGTNGGVDFTNVNAIELEIAATQVAMDGEVAEIVIVDFDPQILNIMNPAAAAEVDIETLTNGVQADLATDVDVPIIGEGGTVVWTYIVSNTGGGDLTDVVVTDSILGAVSNIIDQGDGDNILQPGEAWTFEATGSGMLGDYENIGAVTATASDDSTVVDSDLSHYRGVLVGLSLDTSVNGFEADEPDSAVEVRLTEPGAIPSGPIFTFVFENTGEVPLRDLVLTIDNGTPLDLTDDTVVNIPGTLEPGETGFQGQIIPALPGLTALVGRIRSVGPTGPTVDSVDSAFYIGLELLLDWHNERLPRDVNGDGFVSPLDAALIINELTDRVFSDPTTGLLPEVTSEPEAFYDVNDDGFAAPLDALLVISALGTTPPAVDLNGDEPGTSSSASFDEEGGPTLIANEALSITTAESTTLTSATITITDLLNGVDESLSVDVNGTSITADFANGVLKLSGTDSIENYEKVLRTLTYDNVSQAPGAGRLIDVVVADGILPSVAQSILLLVNESNDAPDLAEIDDLFVGVGETLSVLVTASDPDGDALTFLLDRDDPGANVPANATITSIGESSALIEWEPSESDPAGDYQFAVLVIDNGDLPLADRESFVVTLVG